MEDENKDNKVGPGLKLAMTGVVAFIVLVLLAITVLPMLQTVGGSFGYGFPGGSGGRAIRDVEIDVDPQIVYRIDDHRFFTLEKYIDCTHGGFVYYNDTNKKIKLLAGPEGVDKKPQDEVSIGYQNHAMAFKGRFIYAASDNIIAYPWRNMDYKYGASSYFIGFTDIKNPSNSTGSGAILSGADVIIMDNAIYIQDSPNDKYKTKIKIPKKERGDKELILSSEDLHLNPTSQDDRFHCNNSIKPGRIKYISN